MSDTTRDLVADLRFCETFDDGYFPGGPHDNPKSLARFGSCAHGAWSHAIKRAIAAEDALFRRGCELYDVKRERDYLQLMNAEWKAEVERLRETNAKLRDYIARTITFGR